ncbi:hypothetical protein [Coxiella endosymbiont of Ornithodoros maritimus]|uniref:hypothetical protein n=1 Tax=Coxiella endosymbiont of Ornithodoros maritimus TaxID=1656172 RepID=UPI00226514E1|nr:hypothetical protein [Coxiella endosymbiont of Ornithodoros maritimus]
MVSGKIFKKTYSGTLGLNSTIGAVAGAIWQIVFVACIASNLNPIIISLFVGMAVAACNISSTKLIDTINNAKCFPEKNAVEIDSEAVGSEIEIESEEASNVSENQASASNSPNSLFNENAEKPNNTQ